MSQGRPTKRYRIRDTETDVVVFEGSTNDCARFLGIGLSTFYGNNYNGKKVYQKKLMVEPGATIAELDAEAIRKWDAFTAPLRRMYGIPRYKGDK